MIIVTLHTFRYLWLQDLCLEATYEAFDLILNLKQNLSIPGEKTCAYLTSRAFYLQHYSREAVNLSVQALATILFRRVSVVE